MAEVEDCAPIAALESEHREDASANSLDQRKIHLNPKSADSPLEIVFLGDTSFGENYQQRLEENGHDNILKSKGYDYPLTKMKTLLSDADLVIANLETPITDIQKSPYADTKSYVHWTDVNKAPAHLLKHNISVVSLANNHTFDYGAEGFSQTLQVLEHEKIHYFGAGRNQQEAGEAFMIEATVAGQPFSCAIIGAFQESRSYRREYQAYAEGEQGGVNALNIDTIIKNIRAIKAYNPDTFVIVFPHWGYNYEWKSAAQIKEAQALIDSGADLILGHGAHMLQELERHHNKWIAYSIGNFMFNSPGRYDHYKAPPYSLVAKLIVQAKDDTLSLACRLYPIVTDNKQTSYQSSFVTEQQFNEVCQLLANKNTSPSTLFHGLPRNKDDHGYYLDLPINTQPKLSATPVHHQVGYICNIRNGVISGMKAKKWMFRAVSMSRALQQQGLELFIYAYNHVDPNTGTVRGYIIENDQFVEKEAPVPAVNYDWFLGPKVQVHNRHMNYATFSAWAEKNSRAIFPHKAYMSLSKDKFLSYKTIADFDAELGIYTEVADGKLEQLERFIKKSGSVFLKPQFGNSGNDIIVIKKLNDKVVLNHYDMGEKASLSLNSLASALNEAKKLMRDNPFVIQSGIITERINSSTFDIRMVVIGERNAWKIIPEVRLGATESDLSNVSQGGSCIELDQLLSHLSNKINPAQFKEQLFDTVQRLTAFLDAYFPSQLMEMAYDIILDTHQKMHITEINCKPGSPMIFTDFNNMFDLNNDERVLYTHYIEPHGKLLAEYMHKRWQAAQSDQPKIWFDSLSSPLALSTDDKIKIMVELHQALNEKRTLNTANFPPSVTQDTAPRIVFLSFSNGFSRAHVAIGAGFGLLTALGQAITQQPVLFKEQYRPIWIKLDIVTESLTHHQVDLNKPLNLERTLSGIAFTSDIDIAFLPEQLNANTLITSDSHLHRRNIAKYIAPNPYLNDRFQGLKNLEQATLYEFKTESLFFNGETYLPLYRGHRQFESISKDYLLDSVDLATDYLIRSVDLNGKFAYSYESKIDNVQTSYNILRHAGTLYSMLEVYELLRDESILTAVQRGLRYLINQTRETIVNNEKTLVVIEDGYLKLGGNALAALAIAKFIHVTQDRSYLPIAQQLGAWIVNTQNDRGEFTIHKQTYNAEIIKGFDSEYYPGEALFALSRLYQLDPQPRWLNSAVNGALFLINVRDKGLADEKLNHDHWLLYALNEIYRLQPNQTLFSHAMKIANVIVKGQRLKSPYSDWIGSYYNPPRSTPAATRMEGLCASYELANDYGTPQQTETILEAIKLGVNFQLQTQFLPESVMYLPNPQRALGAFHRSLTDFEIRIDYVQHNISSLLGLYKILSKTQAVSAE